MRSILLAFMLMLALPACTELSRSEANPSLAAVYPQAATAVFAGGCFWCSESDFESQDGVLGVESGYTGGKTVNPTYHDVSSGDTGHTEAVRVYYDPAKVSYEKLLAFYWRTIDPTAKDRQFCDTGNQYRTGVYYSDETQRKLVEASRDGLLKSGAVPRIETEIAPLGPFYVAEEYHQDFYKKNPVRYQYYRARCGRDERLEMVWGKTSH